MNIILTIGLNTFREAIRNKVLYSLLFFAIVVIAAALAFGALSVHEEVRLTTDLGLGGMSLFSVIIAIFVGINLLYKELERKTIYSIVSKPIRRYQVVLGKFVGMVLTLAVLVAIMTAVLVGVIHFQGGEVGAALFKMVTLIFLEVVVVTAVAVLFSSFSTPFLSGMFTMGVFVLGRSVPDIRLASAKIESPALSGILDTISLVVPNLKTFFITGADIGKNHVSIHGDFPGWAYVGNAAGYAALTVGLVLLLAIFLFSRRDFI